MVTGGMRSFAFYIRRRWTVQRSFSSCFSVSGSIYTYS